MHRLRAGTDRCTDHGGDVQVALAGGRWADPHGDVGLGDVPGAGVGVAENRDGTDAQRAQRADDPHRDLATVGNQDSVEAHHHILNTP